MLSEDLRFRRITRRGYGAGTKLFSHNTNLLLEKAKTPEKNKNNLKTSGPPPEFTVHPTFSFVYFFF